MSSPLCRPRCHDDSECCNPPQPPPGWKDCPDGYEPDWCYRLDELKELYPQVFHCATARQLQRWWDKAMCLIPRNECNCNPELRREMLICHFAVVETKMAAAYETAAVAGAMRGKVHTVLPLVNARGGGINLADGFYLLSVYGVEYMSLRADDRRNVTGAYAYVPKTMPMQVAIAGAT